MLLDSQSTVNVVMDKELVKYICDACGQFICVYYNAGTRIIRTGATLPGFRTIWFDNRCITNILSMSKSKNKYRVMYDSAEGNKFIIFLSDKEVLFIEIFNGIYYHDLENRDLVLVNTLEENR